MKEDWKLQYHWLKNAYNFFFSWNSIWTVDMLKRKENYTKRTFAEFGITMQQTADINAKIEVFFSTRQRTKEKWNWNVVFTFQQISKKGNVKWWYSLQYLLCKYQQIFTKRFIILWHNSLKTINRQFGTKSTFWLKRSKGRSFQRTLAVSY